MADSKKEATKSDMVFGVGFLLALVLAVYAGITVGWASGLVVGIGGLFFFSVMKFGWDLMTGVEKKARE